MPTLSNSSKPELEPIEMASREEISALQLERLKNTLENAYKNVPFYKKKFDEAGVTPDDLNSLSDLNKFPFCLLYTSPSPRDRG